MTCLEARALSIGYGRKIVGSGIELSLAPGSVTCLLGPNGVGKTTLFRTLLGLIAPLGGTITLENQAIGGLSRGEVARRIAYVPQNVAGEFAYSVLDLVLMGRTARLGVFASPRRVDVAAAMDALARLGIAELAHHDATRISGGQRQLALIARALAQQARLVVMDEPTASLDLGNRLRVLAQIEALAGSGCAVLLSTHEPDQAFAIADSVAVFSRAGAFEVGVPRLLLTADRLSALYGVRLAVEQTSGGRLVVGADTSRRDFI